MIGAIVSRFLSYGFVDFAALWMLVCFGVICFISGAVFRVRCAPL